MPAAKREFQKSGPEERRNGDKSDMTGAIINAGAIVAGGVCGTLFGKLLKHLAAAHADGAVLLGQGTKHLTYGLVFKRIDNQV